MWYSVAVIVHHQVNGLSFDAKKYIERGGGLQKDSDEEEADIMPYPDNGGNKTSTREKKNVNRRSKIGAISVANKPE